MTDERRNDPRKSRQSQVNFEIRFNDEKGKPNRVVCQSLDVSKGGLRIILDHELPVGFITELCVENRSRQLMLLYAEVRWCRPSNGGFQCGFQLLDAEQSDLAHWIADSDDR